MIKISKHLNNRITADVFKLTPPNSISIIRNDQTSSISIQACSTKNKFDSESIKKLTNTQIANNNIRQQNELTNTVSKKLPLELISAIHDIYEPSGMKVTNAQREQESEEYGACRFRLNSHNIAFRIAKTTPTKIGQFVTLWKRAAREIEPLDTSDGIDFVVISVSDKIHHGQFIFDQRTLLKEKILSNNGKRGKTAFRVYPPWTKPIAPQAIATQKWQLNYFLSINEGGIADLKKVHNLFLINI